MTLGALLRNAGLQPRALAAWAGTDRIPLVARRLGELGAPPASPASAALVLFVAGAEVPRALLAPVLAASDLVAPSGTASLLARVAILPAGRALVVCDRADRAGDDVVCWPDDSSYHLAAAIPPGRVESWLDLGCGSAFAPLVHPERATAIVGSDLNPRGARFARLGAELSGIGHLAIREGDLADAAPERFALVTCNAPIPDHDGPMWSATTTDFVARLYDHAARAVQPAGVVVVHAVLDALVPVVTALPGERTVVAYTPLDGPREFGVAWWRPGAEARLTLARRALTTDRPHLDHDDRLAALAGTLPPV